MTDMSGRLDAALAGRYRVERELGQGGMATVYLAQDLKHERRVALKVLRPDLAAILGAERFLKEIRLTANLQHPHILPLLDSGQVEVSQPADLRPLTLLFYVMPFVEGESLRDRLTREHQLAIEEAVRFATEVADALNYAHGQGVIHRDIKPENILLYGGHALVADFGIALAASRSEGSTRITETGISLGTPAYMAPEQAMGERDLTPRADIYSLSCVLYEMLAGDPPFQGGSAQAIVAKVLTERAPLVSAARETVPRHIAAAVNKGLARLPADRFATASAFAEALRRPDALSAPTLEPYQGQHPFPGTSGRTRRVVIALGGALVAALVLGLWGWLRTPAAQAVQRFPVALPEGEGVASAPGPALALSPDGSRLVYVAHAGRGVQLKLWSFDALEMDSIPGTTGAAVPAFAPDGRSLVFWDQGALKTVSLPVGPPLRLVDSASFLGNWWGPDGFVYYARATAHPGISRIPTAGGAPETITTIDSARGEVDHRWVSVLPNGKAALFTVWRGSSDRAEIAVVDLRTKRVKILTKGVFARYAAPGWIVLARNDHSLSAVPFDQHTLSLTGRAIPLIKGVSVKIGGASDFTLSDNGTLAYVTGNTPVEELVWVTREGVEQPVDESFQEDFTSLALSPDGTRVVLSYATGAPESLWLYNLPGHALSRLTFDGVLNRRPEWSADGGSITFASDRSGQATLWRIPTDGSGGPVRILPADNADVAQEASWSRDGRWLVYRRGPGGSGSRDLMAFRPGRDSTARPLETTGFSESSPRLSADGRWLAYVSDESGRPEVYVRSFPGNGGKWQVSVNGGAEPVWSHSGGELFYRRSDQTMMAASIREQPTFAILARHPLFPASAYAGDQGHAMYGVSPDDQRFLMVKVLRGVPEDPDLGALEQQLVLVQHWLQGMDRSKAHQ